MTTNETEGRVQLPAMSNPAPGEAQDQRRLTRFWAGLLIIVVAALAVRVTYIAAAKKGPCPLTINGVVVGEYHSECTGFAGQASDQVYYNAEANQIAQGDGFTAPLLPGHQPTAEHPPLTVLVLAPVSWVFEHTPLRAIADKTKLSNGTTLYTHVREQRYTMAILGAMLVLLIGLLGRRIGRVMRDDATGDALGLVAAGIAAFYPNLWVNDGLIMSETITSLAVVIAMLLALRLMRRPSFVIALLAGVFAGLATLGRAELVLFIPLLVIPAAYFANRARVVPLAIVGCAGAVLVVGPWVGYNLSRFHQTTFVSTNDGIALAGSNCYPAYFGGGIGLTILRPPCLDNPAPPGDESDVEKAYRTKAVDFIKMHKKWAAVVVAARVGRTWGVFRPMDMLSFNQGEGRERWVTAAGMYTYWPLLSLAIAGGLVLIRRARRGLWVLLVPVIATTVGVAITYGQTRFRAASEPTVVVLASVAILVMVRLVRSPRYSAATQAGTEMRPVVAPAAGG
jgi:4-amino-4-deoxy-L-arabinose transferase-like glycosyltransferase